MGFWCRPAATSFICGKSLNEIELEVEIVIVIHVALAGLGPIPILLPAPCPIPAPPTVSPTATSMAVPNLKQNQCWAMEGHIVADSLLISWRWSLV
jgi:hypothetical protein